MDLHTWLAYAAACLLIAVSPGSGAVLCLSHGLSYGLRAARATILGLEIGLLLVLLVAGAGIGSLLTASETAFWAVKIVGAGYLIYLGLCQWRASGGPALARPSDAPVHRPSWRKLAATGFLTNATNPKGILFMVAVLPQFIDPGRPLAPQLLVLAATMAAIDSAVMAGYAGGASALSRWMAGSAAQRIQNRVFGGLLMAVGAGLLWVKKAQA